jgi:hypothetical protein
MRISLVGMSGSGKSHWSGLLAEAGFRRLCCDDLIRERLSSEVECEGGSIPCLGGWMGFPFQPGYEEKEAKYLALEKEVVSEIVEFLEAQACAGSAENVVLDTTGSVIYVGDALLERIKARSVVVHFTSSEQARAEMLEDYMENPRPVLWRGFFEKRAGESDREALRRCYGILLDAREKLYARLADVALDYETRRDPGFGVREFLALAGRGK